MAASAFPPSPGPPFVPNLGMPLRPHAIPDGGDGGCSGDTGHTCGCGCSGGGGAGGGGGDGGRGPEYFLGAVPLHGFKDRGGVTTDGGGGGGGGCCCGGGNGGGGGGFGGGGGPPIYFSGANRGKILPTPIRDSGGSGDGGGGCCCDGGNGGAPIDPSPIFIGGPRGGSTSSPAPPRVKPGYAA